MLSQVQQTVDLNANQQNDDNQEPFAAGSLGIAFIVKENRLQKDEASNT